MDVDDAEEEDAPVIVIKVTNIGKHKLCYLIELIVLQICDVLPTGILLIFLFYLFL
jgi:hypothetical protein